MLRRCLLTAALLLATCCAQALDRDAFTFTHYGLTLNLLPDRSGMDVNGSVTLRNDAKEPQASAVLQISSALEWRAIRQNGEPVEFLSQDYRSDIDHTGTLSEAIVTFEKPVEPGASVTLEVHYAGNVPQDASRLTKIGAPASLAMRSEWDQVSPDFTAFRGLGYLVWYPVAMEAQSLGDGAKLFTALDAWKLRHHGVTLTLVNGNHLVPEGDSHSDQFAVGNGQEARCQQSLCALDFALDGPGPVLALGKFEKLELGRSIVWYTGSQLQRARDYATAASKASEILTRWFGAPQQPVIIVALGDENASPFTAGNLLFTPLTPQTPEELATTLAPLAAFAAFPAERPWIREGLSGFAQALVREKQKNRPAALSLLNQFIAALTLAEEPTTPVSAEDEQSSSSKPKASKAVPPDPLLYSSDHVILSAKGAFVLWMLRDLAGDGAMQAALKAYRPEKDTERGYLESLVERESNRDLHEFFESWVYNDKGLAKLRLVSAYSHKNAGKEEAQSNWIVTLTAENLGECWVEAPLSVRFEGGERSDRAILPPHQKTVLRIVTVSEPTLAVVNDGSIPETSVDDQIIKLDQKSAEQ